MNLFKAINSLHDHGLIQDMSNDFPVIIEKEELDSSHFDEQEESEELTILINQSGCCDYGFHGQIAVEFNEDGESYFLVYSYTD